MTEEGDIKKGIESYLELQQNMGNLTWDRQNSGEVLIKGGDKFYKLNLCHAGTPDILVHKIWNPIGAPNKWETRCIYFEVKKPKKKPSDIQLERQAQLKEQGCEVYNVYSLEDVIGVLE